MAPLEFELDFERSTATTEQTAVVDRTFRNPMNHQINLGVLRRCAEINWNEPGAPGLILFPVSNEQFNPKPVRRGCWKADHETYNWPCETVSETFPLESGDSYSVRKELWINEETECIPEGSWDCEVEWLIPGEEESEPNDNEGTYVLNIEREGTGTVESA